MEFLLNIQGGLKEQLAEFDTFDPNTNDRSMLELGEDPNPNSPRSRVPLDTVTFSMKKVIKLQKEYKLKQISLQKKYQNKEQMELLEKQRILQEEEESKKKHWKELEEVLSKALVI
jgi:hypothetical protein